MYFNYIPYGDFFKRKFQTTSITDFKIKVPRKPLIVTWSVPRYVQDWTLMRFKFVIIYITVSLKKSPKLTPQFCQISSNMKMSNNPAMYEVLIKQYLLSIQYQTSRLSFSTRVLYSPDYSFTPRFNLLPWIGLYVEMSWSSVEIQ